MLSDICFPRVERRNPALSQGKHLDDSADKKTGIVVALSTHCFVKGHRGALTIPGCVWVSVKKSWDVRRAGHAHIADTGDLSHLQ